MSAVWYGEVAIKLHATLKINCCVVTQNYIIYLTKFIEFIVNLLNELKEIPSNFLVESLANWTYVQLLNEKTFHIKLLI